MHQKHFGDREEKKVVEKVDVEICH